MTKRNTLTARAVATIKKPGLYADGAGLYLQVSTATQRSWIFRFRHEGRVRERGLGSAFDVSLVQARALAAECRATVKAGVDPIAAARASRATSARAKGLTFKQCATRYIEAHKAGWRNPKHIAQWSSTLTTYAGSAFGDLPVALVDTDCVMKALDPIWRTKAETASRVRGRIESVLGWAAVQGYRSGENPARWRGHLDHLLPARADVAAVEHHPAMLFHDVPAFMGGLLKQAGMSALALRFTVLTAARTGEVLGATWGEIDLEARVWTVPGSRMKMQREHRVPLSSGALTVLMSVRPLRVNDSAFVFPGSKGGSGLSQTAMLMLLRRMGLGSITAHGFRSSFRDWAGEATSHPRELAEAALAHTIGDKSEQAYRRGDALAKRRVLMEDWAAFCEGGI